MAIETGKEGPRTTTETAPAQNRLRVLVIVLAVVVVGMGAGLVYLLSKSNEQEEVIQQQGDDNQKLMAEIDQLNTKAMRLEQELQETSLDADQKQERIEKLLKQIESLQVRANQAAQSGRLKDQQLADLRAKMEELTFLKKKYEDRIQALEDENKQLTEERDQLRSDVDNLRSTQNQLQQTVEQRQQEITELANPLTVSGFTFTAYDGDRKTEGAMLKRGKLKTKLVVCANLNENAKINKGPRDLYMVITGPDGKVVQSMQTSSGTFTIGSQQLVYTAKTSVNFQGSREQACFEYVIPDRYEFAKGPYRVEVYVDGHKAGYDSFLVKTTL